MSTVIALRFPAGRYHATPWSMHANEAEVEWPPSPWRLLRALVATWHRKFQGSNWSEGDLAELIERLAGAHPHYRLPPATRAHTRHYMPVRAGSRDRPVLVFDAFVRVRRDDELIVSWDDRTLAERERQLLADLLNALGYVGRAESWVEARLLDGFDGVFNCTPLFREEGSEDTLPMRPVDLLVPLATAEYAQRRERWIEELGLGAKRLKKGQRLILETLPETLLGALRVETGDLRDAGWNLPPAGKAAMYQRPRIEEPPQLRRVRAPMPQSRVTTVRLLLSGKPLPQIEDAVRIGELVRVAAISAADRRQPNDVPPEISGHGVPAGRDHQHAFYLPEDADGDGFIDHVLVHAPGGLSSLAVEALDDLHRRGLWTGNGEEWDVIFEGAWDTADRSRSVYSGSASRWISATPYLHPWYTKRDFGIPEQVRRECARRGLPVPSGIRILPSITVRDRERRAIHFHRFRTKRGLRQPDRRGSMIELSFEDAVGGPLALGFGCHYGLGMFRPAE